MKTRFSLPVLLGILLILGGCSRAELLNLTIPREGFTLVKDVAYGAAVRQKLDIYRPLHSAPGHPVVVFLHGGSWQMGDKDDYLFVGQAFASRGYLTLIPNYRLYPEVAFPVFLEDCARAFVWAHEHAAAYGGEEGRVFLAGHSAGAYNAVMLTLNSAYLTAAGGKPGWIKGTVALAGPYDFLPITDPKLIALFGSSENLATQPIAFARPHLPPLLLMHGDKDEDVLPRNSFNLTARLRDNHDPVALRIYPGFDHIDLVLALADGFRDEGPVLDEVDGFLRGR